MVRWRAQWVEVTAQLPIRLHCLLALGPIFGLLCGTFSYLLQVSLDPRIAGEAGGRYGNVVLHHVLAWSLWFALIPLILVLGRAVRFTRTRWRKALATHVALALALAALYCTIGAALTFGQLWLAGQEIGPAGRSPSLAVVLKTDFLLHFEWQFIIYWGLVGVSHALRFHGEMQARELREAKLQARLMEAQLEALQRQLHPHFLFNALHAVGTIMRRDLDAADEMLDRLGLLLRALMRSEVRQTVSLDAELALTRQYIDIERVRFGPRLSVRVEANEAPRHARVPCLVLQPVVENALRHGIAPRPEGGWIRITAQQVGSRLRLQVADNGVGLGERDRHSGRSQAEETRTGIGLANTRARLEQLYPGDYALRLEPRPGGGVVVTIELPLLPAVPDTGHELEMRTAECGMRNELGRAQ